MVLDIGVIDELLGGIGQFRDHCQQLFLVEWLALIEIEIIGC